MRRYWLALSANVLLLAGIAYGSALWAARLLGELRSYRGLYANVASLPETTPPLTEQVVLVIISGLREDDLEHMPVLQSLSERGSYFSINGVLPSFAQPTWTALLTGANPEIAGGHLLADQGDEMVPLRRDHIIACAQRAGLQIGLAGHTGWERLLASMPSDSSFITSEKGDTGDREILQAALRMVSEPGRGFCLIHFDQVREVTRQTTTNEAVLQALRRIDAYLGEISAELTLSRTCLIVTSDYTRPEREGYGWREPGQVPLVLVGKGIAIGRHASASQTCVAPTIAALLGISPPGVCEGDVLTDALNMSAPARAQLRIVHAAQRAMLAQTYLQGIGGTPLSTRIGEDIAVARQCFEAGNYAGASQLASLALRGARQQMLQEREARLINQRTNRLPLGLLIIATDLILLLRSMSWRKAYLLFIAAIAVVAYHVPFREHIAAYSLDDLLPIREWIARSIWRAFIVMGLGSALAITGMRLVEQKTIRALGNGLLGFGLRVCALLIVPLAVAFALYGIAPTWFVPAPMSLFVWLALLMQLVGSSLALISIGFVVFTIYGVFTGVAWLVHRVARRS